MKEEDKIKYQKLLDELERFQFYEKKYIDDLKFRLHMKNGVKTAVPQQYVERLEISGLHIKHSVYHEPQMKGFLRDIDSIQEALEKRKISLEIRQAMEKELDDFSKKYPDATIDDPKALEELGKIISKYGEKIKTRHDSMKRRINEFKSLVNSNWDQWTHFITLTFKENMTSVEDSQRYFNDWTKKMNAEFDNFIYVAAKEFQKRGAVHFHCLVRTKKKMPKAQFNKVRQFWTELDANKMGNIDIKSVMVKYVQQEYIDPDEWKNKRERHIWSLGNYLTSYLKKGATDPRLFGKKLFTSSSKSKMKQKIVITDKEKIHQTLTAIGVDGLKKKSYKIKEKHFDKNGNLVIGSDVIGEMNFFNMLIKSDEKNNS